MMMTGDSESVAEKAIVKKYRDRLLSTILKASHHASKTASSSVFLKAVMPNTVIISVGADNEYGHPHKEVLKRYGKFGFAVYRTDTDGTITIRSDGKNYTVEKESR